MPSRLPPSQRDPQFALSRALSAIQQMTPGSRGGQVKNATPPRPAIPDRKVAAAGGANINGTGVDSTAACGTITDTEPAPIASGAYSVAVGVGSEANASNSNAIGSYSLASAIRATALGLLATASGAASLAAGRFSNASGDTSAAFGHTALASGDRSLAVGPLADASGARSVAVGYSAAAATDDTMVARVNSLEVASSAFTGTGATSLIISDTAGVRWRITVTTVGALSVALA